MKTFDWIVVGGGLAGSALSYELSKLGFSVLLLEQFAVPLNGTRYSYGGIAYWSGLTDLTRQLCQEGIEIHRTLSTELDSETQFREMNLLLTIEPDRDPDTVASGYQNFAIPPTLLSPESAGEIEPLLNQQAIAAALLLPHGHVSPEATLAAYQQAFTRLGGVIEIAQVKSLIQKSDRIQGVVTSAQRYEAANVAICAGGFSRALLNQAGISTRLYFTQAEVIETPPLDLQLQTIIMPAELKRFAMESEAGRADQDALWDQPGHEIVAPILDVGAIQFQDSRVRIGQVSRTLTDPYIQANAAESEAEIRQAVGQLLPALQHVPGKWYSCLVSFSGDRLPLVGAIAGTEGLHLFSGFSNPFALLPPIARRFAQSAMGQSDALLAQLSPNRLGA
ncbi:MAG TPA: FAD-binding oxidoreductase [Coleofasciculaceae cyanobacterium]